MMVELRREGSVKTAGKHSVEPGCQGRGLRPWQPGQSGNPGGRPKVNPELRRAAQEHSVEALDVLVEVMRTGRPGERLQAAREILDRAYGKPSQAVEVTDATPMTLIDLLASISPVLERSD